ncbi:MAG: GNAT family N-acetyltransferase [Sphingomicrobium sp.]
MNLIFHEDELDHPDVVALLDLHVAALRVNSPPEACHVLPAAALKDSASRFFSARDEDGTLMGFGALKTLRHDHGELKSMRTMPGALGRGVGGALLAHLVEQARAAGMTRLSLETGSSTAFAAALHLYRRDGFVVCGPFGDYRPTAFTRFFTRAI